MKDDFEIYYDGGCPACSYYVLMSRIQKQFNVKLYNLREHPEKAKSFLEDGFDVDEGMLVVINGSRFFGADAIYILNLYGESRGFLSFIMRSYFRHRFLARITYPLLRFGRNTLLKILGRKKMYK